MKYKLFFLLAAASFFFLLLSTIGCSEEARLGESIVLYRDFNLFTLTGDTVINTHGSSSYVKVKYLRKFPVSINYWTSENNILLSFEDSFLVDNKKSVYVYSTGNLLRGQAGPQWDHSFRFEDMVYKLFITLNDTIICKTYDKLGIVNDNYWYSLNEYVYKKKDTVVAIRGLNNSNDGEKWLGKQIVYKKYMGLLDKYWHETSLISAMSNIMPYPREVVEYSPILVR